MEIRHALEVERIEYRDRGTNVGADHINICCPFCSDEKFHCGIHETKYIFHCWVCGSRGKWWKLRQRLIELYGNGSGALHRVDVTVRQPIYVDGKRERYNTKIDSEYDSYFRHFDSFDLAFVSYRDIESIQFLIDYPENFKDPYRSRGIDPSILPIISPFIGIGEFTNSIGFNVEGEWMVRRYVQTSKANWWKSKSGLYYGREFVIDEKPKWVVLTEGVFDVFALPLGYAVALGGTHISSNRFTHFIDSLGSSIDHVILAFDRDVRQSVIDQMCFDVSDLGLGYAVFDWSKIPMCIKDIDEVRLRLGPNYMSEWVMDQIGVPFNV